MYLYLNCKKIKLNLFSLLLNLFVFSSCVVYYNTNDIRKTIQTNINQITTNYSKIKIDYNKKTKIYNQLSKYIINPELESFKTISQNLLIAIKSLKYNFGSKISFFFICSKKIDVNV